MTMIKLLSLKRHPKNPRKITGPKMEALKKSLTDFPKMMELTPFIIDENNIVLRGNMRHQALEELGYKEIPKEWVKKARDLTPAEKDRFMILDNDHFGEWDHDILAANWPTNLFADWGLTTSKLPGSAPLTSTRTKADKGTIVRIKCKDNEAAKTLFQRLLAEGFDVELK